MSIYGLDAEEMPDRWTPLEAIAVLKCLDQDGEVALLTRATPGTAAWDAVGMLTAALDLQRRHLADGFIAESGDEDYDDDDE